MRKSSRTYSVFGFLLAVLALSSCTVNPDSPGLEYMPDMYRSPAVEAYVDYGLDPYLVGEDVAAEQRMKQSARKPVAGTIAHSGNAELAMPYPYPEGEAGYEAAGAELKSPIPGTLANYNAGQEVFERMCIHCHGEAGAGDGSITQVSGGKYPVVPAYNSRADLPEGKMYHTLMYGKGLMGSHASQISPMERWQVIQYIKPLFTGVAAEFDEAGNMKEGGSELAAPETSVENAEDTELTADN